MSVNNIKTIANIITVNLMASSTKTGTPVDQLLPKQAVIDLAQLFDESKISNVGLSKAIDVLISAPDLTVQEVVTSNNLLQVSDTGSLGVIVDTIIDTNPTQASQYREGKVQVIGYLVGQCMKESKGQGNPKLFNELLVNKLSS